MLITGCFRPKLSFFLNSENCEFYVFLARHSETPFWAQNVKKQTKHAFSIMGRESYIIWRIRDPCTGKARNMGRGHVFMWSPTERKTNSEETEKKQNQTQGFSNRKVKRFRASILDKIKYIKDSKSGWEITTTMCSAQTTQEEQNRSKKNKKSTGLRKLFHHCKGS